MGSAAGSVARSERAVVANFQAAKFAPAGQSLRQLTYTAAERPERRRHPRHDLVGHCWIDAPSVTLLGPTHDIGVGGLFVRTAAKLELGTQVELCLRVPGEAESLCAQALVARSVPIGFGPPCHGLGLEFRQIAQGHSLLRVLLNRTTPPLG